MIAPEYFYIKGNTDTKKYGIREAPTDKSGFPTPIIMRPPFPPLIKDFKINDKSISKIRDLRTKNGIGSMQNGMPVDMYKNRFKFEYTLDDNTKINSDTYEIFDMGYIGEDVFTAKSIRGGTRRRIRKSKKARHTKSKKDGKLRRKTNRRR